MDKKNKRVMVGMSGGVDSSVAALLLQQQGYEVIGVTIKLWDNFETKTCEKVCCSIEDVYDAKKVCDNLNIPHYTVNFKQDFKTYVMDYFVDEYNLGRTPSPCIICNEKIKFGKMLEFAKTIDCDYIATGHYAISVYDENYEKYVLRKGIDKDKDQSYMLYRLSQEQLKSTLFPLGGMTKKEVRKIAEENNIITYNKKDSQGICFVMGDYKKFLVENCDVKKGRLVDEKGNVIGDHEGYQLYTIGQRRGLGLNDGRPWFILDIIPEENKIIIGEYDKLMRKEVLAESNVFNLKEIMLIEGEEVFAKPRFSSRGNSSKIYYEDEKIRVVYANANAQNTRGQHIVFYIGETVLGGGIIK